MSDTMYVTVTLLAKMLKYVPNRELSSRIERMGPYFRLGDKSDIWLAYALGFPVHIDVPPKELLLQALKNKVHNPCSSRSIASECNLADMRSVSRANLAVDDLIMYQRNAFNLRDYTNASPILSFSPMDVVRYIGHRGKVIQFCRSDYHQVVINAGVHPLTKTLVPDDVMYEMHKRVMLADKHSLPCECIPLDLISLFDEDMSSLL
jgi:hypothetical protein